MAGLLQTQECSPASRELFRLLDVGICGRPSNGQILFDHYRYKRRRFAGDERVCHQSMTAMCWPTARPKAPADERFRLSLAGSLKRRAPARLARSLREHMLRISMRWARQRRCASLSQDGIARVRNGAQNNGAQTPPPGPRSAAMPSRFDWLTKLRGGRIRRTFFALGQIFD
jgi:hypothetical protein